MGTIAHEQFALLTDYDTTSQYTMAYQNLFTNIRFGWDQEKSRQQTITFVAPTAHKGLSAAISNIAIAAAQNGVPTVLVDTNIHNPGLQQQFGTQVKQGLSEFLSGEAITPQSLSESLSKTFIPDLFLLSAGSPHYQPVEISRMLSARFSKIVDELRQYLATNESRPCLIIFNSPPMSSGTDALLISSVVDQAFLLIIAGQTKRNQVQRAQEQLERAHANVAGAIMLDV